MAGARPPRSSRAEPAAQPRGRVSLGPPGAESESSTLGPTHRRCSCWGLTPSPLRAESPPPRSRTSQPPPPGEAGTCKLANGLCSAAPRRRRSPPSPSAQAQAAAAAPSCAGALPTPSRLTILRKISLSGAAATEGGPEKAADTPPLRNCWPSWLYLRL